MEKKILVLVGSGRKNGNTALLAEAFCRGAEKAGNKVSKIELCGQKIEGCIDCQYCYKHEGRCVKQDDMERIYQAMAENELLVIASPVYFYNFPSQLKAVFDRMHNPIRKTFGIKETVLLSICADQGTEVFAPMIATYQAIIHYLGWKDRGIVTIDGVEKRGAVRESEKLKLAEALGKNV